MENARLLRVMARPTISDEVPRKKIPTSMTGTCRMARQMKQVFEKYVRLDLPNHTI